MAISVMLAWKGSQSGEQDRDAKVILYYRSCYIEAKDILEWIERCDLSKLGVVAVKK